MAVQCNSRSGPALVVQYRVTCFHTDPKGAWDFFHSNITFPTIFLIQQKVTCDQQSPISKDCQRCCSHGRLLFCYLNISRNVGIIFDALPMQAYLHFGFSGTEGTAFP